MNQSIGGNLGRILIVGGGTAGWLAAYAINKFVKCGDGPHCEVCLIESPAIGTVSVGEATVPTIGRTLRHLGLPESEWMAACDATFKQAIKFVNWSGREGREDVYWHPFDKQAIIPSVALPILHYWVQENRRGNHWDPFDCFEQVGLCRANKAPKTLGHGEYEGEAIYAYHLDAGKLGGYLREKAIAEGVVHCLDNVQDVVLDEKGFIDHLVTKDHGDLAADFFVDCSGFRGLLINKALEEPFVSYQDHLFCDRAIAMSVPYREEPETIEPYTTATALGSGWVWNIPLTSRIGSGYVYSSDFCSPDDAEAEYRTFLGAQARDVEARHIRMRVGRNRNVWVKNCVSIGLASGFIEPLESTGIYLIEKGILNFLHHFPTKQYRQEVVTSYNKSIQREYEEVLDFIVLHYCLTQREDTPFWKANKHHRAIPESLQNALAQWRHFWPNQLDRFGNLFGTDSYMCILIGMGLVPRYSHGILDYRDGRDGRKTLERIRTRRSRLLDNLPDQKEYLRMRSAMVSLMGILGNSSQVNPQEVRMR